MAKGGLHHLLLLLLVPSVAAEARVLPEASVHPSQAPQINVKTPQAQLQPGHCATGGDAAVVHSQFCREGVLSTISMRDADSAARPTRECHHGSDHEAQAPQGINKALQVVNLCSSHFTHPGGVAKVASSHLCKEVSNTYTSTATQISGVRPNREVHHGIGFRASTPAIGCNTARVSSRVIYGHCAALCGSVVKVVKGNSLRQADGQDQDCEPDDPAPDPVIALRRLQNGCTWAQPADARMLVSECVKTAILGAVPPWVPLPGAGLLLVTLTGADADVCVPPAGAPSAARGPAGAQA